MHRQQPADLTADTTLQPADLNPYAYMWKTLQGIVYVNNAR